MQEKDPCQRKKTKISMIYQILGYMSVMTFLILLLVIKGISFSSYKRTSAGFESARVAKPVLTFSNSDYVKGVTVGKTATIEFTVSNDDQGQYSEIALEYTIKIEKLYSEEGNITYTLYESSDSGATYTTEVATGTNLLTYSSTTPLSARTHTKHYFRLQYIPSFESHSQPLFNISIDAEQSI